MRIGLVIAVILIVAACGDQQPVVKLVPAAGPTIPDSLLTCPDSPTVPDEEATQADVGRYVLDLYEVGAECRGKLGAVRSILESH